MWTTGRAHDLLVACSPPDDSVPVDEEVLGHPAPNQTANPFRFPTLLNSHGGGSRCS
jgi:hypothetical protein